jgi:hypothetical protein
MGAVSRARFHTWGNSGIEPHSGWTRPVRHSAPLHLSIFARPHEVGLVDSWGADSQRKTQKCFLCRLLLTVAASVFVFQIDGVETKFLLANSNTEFSHGLGQSRLGGASCRSSHVRNAPLATLGLKKAACREG